MIESLKGKFATKKELFNFLIANKKEIITLKKQAFKICDPFGMLPGQREANKALSTSYKDDLESGVIKRTIIGNTYNYMDSHDDVHADNVFEKSIKEKGDNIWHLHDHLRQITAKVGKPVSVYEKTVSWKDVGLNIEGKTMALFMDSNIMKAWNELIYQQYLNKEINQHSVGMMYVNLALAIDDADMKEEFATWKSVIDKIGNKDEVKDQGYFWYVKEAKLDEISAVLAGSNDLTPTVENKMEELLAADDVNKKELAEKNFYLNLAKELKANPIKL